MDLRLVIRGLDFTRKRRKWVFMLAAFGVTGYGVYRVYNSPSVVRNRNKFFKLISALVSVAELVSHSAETFGILSKDLKEFLQSDSDEIPNSLKQISKIAQSKEFCDSIVRVSASLTRGVSKGYHSTRAAESSSGFCDQFMEKLFSNAGSGFASVVVGSFAKNLVMAFYSNEEPNGELNVDHPGSADASLRRCIDLVCDERCREVIGDWIQTFVSTAVAVYLDKSMNMNAYDEFFAALTNPKHGKQVRDMVVSVCNGSIETLVKASHRVLTSSSSSSDSDSKLPRCVVTRSKSDVVQKTLCPPINNKAHNVIAVNHNRYERGVFFDIGEGEITNSSDKSGWISTMSSTFAVPSNRKFVLDVTGRVTFETVRSFLEFLLEKIFLSVKGSVRAAKETVVDSGVEVLRYATAKASVVASICLSLCLHVLGDNQALMSA